MTSSTENPNPKLQKKLETQTRRLPESVESLKSSLAHQLVSYGVAKLCKKVAPEGL